MQKCSFLWTCYSFAAKGQHLKNDQYQSEIQAILWSVSKTHTHVVPCSNNKFLNSFSVVMNFRAGPSAAYLPFIVQPGVTWGHWQSVWHTTTQPPNLISMWTCPQCMTVRKRLETWIKPACYNEKYDRQGGTEKCDTTAGAVHLLSGTQ